MDKEVERFVDANIFLEVLLKDIKWEEAAGYLEKLSSGRVRAFTSDFIIYSIILQIEEKKKSSESVRDFAIFLGNMKGLRIARFTPGILINAVSIMEKHSLDFDDSLQAAFMHTLGIKEIVSFDSHFDKMGGIKRIEPREILG